MPSMRITQVEHLDRLTGDLFGAIQSQIEGKVNNLGFQPGYNYYMLGFVFKIIGSVDYFNTITLKNRAYAIHPLSLTFIEDDLPYGYINGDIENFSINDGSVRRVKDEAFDVGGNDTNNFWTYSPPVPLSWTDYNDEDVSIKALPIDYPAWNGWPEVNDTLPSRPEGGLSGTTTLPVFYLAQYITIQAGPLSSISTDDRITIDVSDAIDASKWDTDDIRIFHFVHYDYVSATSLDEELPQLKVNAAIECARAIDISTGTMTFNPTTTIDVNKKHTFVMYWSSPDIWVASNLPNTTISLSGSNVTADITITAYSYVNYFYRDRVDFIQYKYTNPILKAKNRTFEQFGEQDERIYNFEDPVFYPMERLSGTIDEYILSIYEPDGPGPFFPSGGALQYYSFGQFFGGLSLNYRDSSGNYPDKDAVFGVVIGVKSQADIDSTYQVSTKTKYEILKGPDIFPDMFPEDWSDFAYYPTTSKDFIPYIHLIVGQLPAGQRSENTARATIVHLEYTESYASASLDNADLVNVLSDSLVDMYGLATNRNIRFMVPNIAFSTFFKKMAFQNDSLIEAVDVLSIYYSYEKYSTQGLVLDTSTGNTLASNSILAGARSSKEILATEALDSDSITLPWFLGIFYWTNPTPHGVEHYTFTHENNWMCAYARGIDTSTQYVNYQSGDTNYDPSISYDPLYPVQSGIYTLQDRDNAKKTGLSLNNRTIFTPTTLELYFKDNEAPSTTNLDLSLNFTFRDYLQNNIIKKDYFIPASRYYLTDATREQRLLDDSQSVDGYIYPGYLNSLKQYQMFGESIIMSNARKGQARIIEMKPLDPDDPDLPTYAEFVNSWIDSNPNGTWDDLRDAIQYQEEYGGGFDTIDLRTLTNRATSLEEIWLAVTTYTKISPTWQYQADWMSRGAKSDFITSAGPRWGYRVNGIWEYQSFIEDNVITNRINYLNTHYEATTDSTNNPLTIAKKQERHELIDNQEFALNGSVDFLAQTFIADFSESILRIGEIDLWLSRTGSNADVSLGLYIYETLNDRPYGSPLNANPAIVSFNSINDSDGDWITFTLDNEIWLDADAGKKYAIVLTTIGHIDDELDNTTFVAWKFAEDNTYAYGVTNSFTFTAIDAVPGSSGIIVEDATIFPDAPFFVTVGDDLYYVSTVSTVTINGTEYDLLVVSDYTYEGQTNTGFVAGDDYYEYSWYVSTDTSAYSSGTPVFLVNFNPYDSSERLYVSKVDEGGMILSAWTLPDNSQLDASFRIYTRGDVVEEVSLVPQYDWFGDDLTPAEELDLYADVFYIGTESTEYDIDRIGWGVPGGIADVSYIYKGGGVGSSKRLVGLSYSSSIIRSGLISGYYGSPIPISGDGYIFGGFNTHGMEGFPAPNSIRSDEAIASNTKVDGYWAWNTIRSTNSERIKIIPAGAKYYEKVGDNDIYTLEYIPFINNIYLTIGLVRANGTRKVVNKFLPGKIHILGEFDGTLASDAIVDTSGIKTYNITPTLGTLSAESMVGKQLFVTSGGAVNLYGLIVANSTSTITLLEPLHTAPEASSEFYIGYSTNIASDTDTIVNTSTDTSTNTTTITISGTFSESPTSYTLWVINDLAWRNRRFTIIDSTANTATIGGLYDFTDDGSVKIAIIKSGITDEIENPFTYGIEAPVLIDDEKFIGVDHIHISNDGFPDTSYDGNNNSFLIKSGFTLLSESAGLESLLADAEARQRVSSL